MTELTLFDLLRASHVQRWHILNCSRQQNVAEHSYMVTVIALALYRLMVGTNPTNMDEAEIMQLLVGALFHDSPEIRTGDIPTPGKLLIEDFAPGVFQQMDKSLMPTLPFVGGVVPPNLRRFIKMADTIEAAHWIRNNGAGDYARQVADKCRTKVAELTDTYGEKWREPVNEVLDALGMDRLRWVQP